MKAIRFIRLIVSLIVIGLATMPLLAQRQQTDSPATDVIDIGLRRELLVDGFLVDHLAGKAELRLHHPVPQEVDLVTDAPWEGSRCNYYSIFKDGDRYRMYYEASQYKLDGVKLDPYVHPFFLCYAESDDGVHWRKPNLGLNEFKGSKANNIVLVSGRVGSGSMEANADAGVFKDDNPNAAPDAVYKAILRSSNPKGLTPFKSPDGIHWSAMSDVPVITDGDFDSQNLAFWDGARGEYRIYWRFEYFTGSKGYRAIRTATSKDFLHWSAQADVCYVDSPTEELYTSQIKPYYRAPQLLIGFPTRYIERGWSDAMRALPEREDRELRARANERYGTALTEGLLMSSRDGVTFKRWNEAFLPPGIERKWSWNYGQQYIGWHLVETKSALEGAPNELSLYATEDPGDWNGNNSALRRYTLRLDGFVSAQAPMGGGELVSKPVRFRGKKLALNFATSAAGSVRVEIQDMNGKPVPGFALEDCPPIFGDAIERVVKWEISDDDVSAIVGRPVRLRFELKDADLYSFKFEE